MNRYAGFGPIPSDDRKCACRRRARWSSRVRRTVRNACAARFRVASPAHAPSRATVREPASRLRKAACVDRPAANCSRVHAAPPFRRADSRCRAAARDEDGWRRRRKPAALRCSFQTVFVLRRRDPARHRPSPSRAAPRMSRDRSRAAVQQGAPKLCEVEAVGSGERSLRGGGRFAWTGFRYLFGTKR